MARQQISKKTRFEIFKRDDFICRYCGRGIGADIILEIDHILPVIEGGTNEQMNLITACFECNRGKSKNLLDEKSFEKFIPNKDKTTLIKVQKEQLAAFFEYRKQQAEIKFQLARDSITPIINLFTYPEKNIPRYWFRTVGYFLKEFPHHVVYEAAEIAAERFLTMGVNNPYAYFCGICHKAIKEKNNE